jgi:hypothetical protein
MLTAIEKVKMQERAEARAKIDKEREGHERIRLFLLILEDLRDDRLGTGAKTVKDLMYGTNGRYSWCESAHSFVLRDAVKRQLALYGMGGLKIAFDGPLGQCRVSEDEALCHFVRFLNRAGVEPERLAGAEIRAREKMGQTVLPKPYSPGQEEGRLQHTITSLSLEIGGHARFSELCDLNYERNGTYVDLELWVLDLARAAERRLTGAWEEDERDFMTDIPELACYSVRCVLSLGGFISAEDVLDRWLTEGCAL